MRSVLYELAELINEGIPYAFGEVVDTRGSTPQKPGAKAIFCADGRVLGTLGGGHLEAEAERVAFECLQQRRRTLLTIHLDNDYSGDGSICGGVARIFLDGKPDEHASFWNEVATFLRSRKRGAAITVVNSTDSEILGARWLIEEERRNVCAPETLAQDFKIVARSSEYLPDLPPNAFELVSKAMETSDEVIGTVSFPSGEVELFIEPLLPRPHLIIAGAGHVGSALAHLASLLDFEVTVIDDRPSLANRERLPEVDNILVGDIAQTVASQPMDKDTYIVIVTRGHRHDAETLRGIIKCVDEVAYIGMIGSRRKIKFIYDDLVAQGVATFEQLAKIHAPIGIDIGGEGVWEIALSIAAELVWIRNGKKGSLRPLSEKILPLILKKEAMSP